MRSIHTIKDIAAEARIVRGRVIAACFGVLLLAGLLVLRMAQLQVVEYEHFSTLSEDNRVKIVALAPPDSRPTRSRYLGCPPTQVVARANVRCPA